MCVLIFAFVSPSFYFFFMFHDIIYLLIISFLCSLYVFLTDTFLLLWRTTTTKKTMAQLQFNPTLWFKFIPLLVYLTAEFFITLWQNLSCVYSSSVTVIHSLFYIWILIALLSQFSVYIWNNVHSCMVQLCIYIYSLLWGYNTRLQIS